MSKKSSLAAKAMSLTVANLVKGRGASGKTTYLDRFVDVLLNEDGTPTEPKTRMEITSEIALAIAIEDRDEAMLANPELKPIDLDTNEEDIAAFIKIATKVKPMVAAAVSDSNNSTALSYNDKYKDVWTVVKDGGKVSLQAK